MMTKVLYLYYMTKKFQTTLMFHAILIEIAKLVDTVVYFVSELVSLLIYTHTLTNARLSNNWLKKKLLVLSYFRDYYQSNGIFRGIFPACINLDTQL